MIRRILMGLAVLLAAALLWRAPWRGATGPVPALSTDASREAAADWHHSVDLAAEAMPASSVAEDAPPTAGSPVAGADEMPWGNADVVASSSVSDGDAELLAIVQNGDLPALQAWFDALDTRRQRREAFRRLARCGDEAGLASALALLWTLPVSDPLYEDGLQAMAGMDHSELADWLADALSGVVDEEVRERLTGILAVMSGPATVQSIESMALAADDPREREPWLALLEQRTSMEEWAPLAQLAESDDPEMASAAACGLANIGGWEACLWLAEAASAPGAPSYFAEALASGLSVFSREALRVLAADPAAGGAVRGAAQTALSASNRSPAVDLLVSPPVEQGTDPLALNPQEDERWF